jgi:rubrerythrin
MQEPGARSEEPGTRSVIDLSYSKQVNSIICPNCGHAMLERRCKLICPLCRYTET